jgi:hypothetical protein
VVVDYLPSNYSIFVVVYFGKIFTYVNLTSGVNIEDGDPAKRFIELVASD